jgi:hypothetical protein
MRSLRAVFVSFTFVLVMSGCFQVEKVVKVKPDGSGTIEETLLIPKTALAAAAQLAGGNGGKGPDFFDEVKFKQAASKMGEGVTYVSGKKVSTDAGEGFSVVYAFADINQLKLDQNLIDAMPGPAGGPAAGREPDPVYFHFTKGNPAELVVSLPPPKLERKSAPADGADDMAMKMMEQMLKDLKMNFAVEVEGQISETNATYRDGSRVTLVELDFNKVLANPEKFKGLARANPQSMPEARALLKGLEGVKMEALPEVRIKFQ